MKKNFMVVFVLSLYLSLSISCSSLLSFSSNEFDSCNEDLNVTFKVIDTVEVDNEL